MNGSLLLALGAVSGAISVMLGAFGAHALKARLSADALSAFQTAVQYQMMHSLALIAVGLWLVRHPDDMLSRYAAVAFCFGILFFSGSLYGLTLGGPRWLGPVTPIGGTLFIAGWLLFAVAAIKTPIP
ncbi:MAG: DUF423 domain-containing protein [Gammaproteobacteria bacterium]|jgi:uncharacterized membrane protein YgdD (TMEM256/DUF423 family)